jgi:hypothetical protein
MGGKGTNVRSHHATDSQLTQPADVGSAADGFAAKVEMPGANE